MKKLIPIITLLFAFASCSSDDDYYNVEITEKGSIYHRNSKNDNDKYDNRFYATVVNKSSTPIKGHVRFEIKDYGYINSTTETVTNQPNTQHTFGASLETDEIINESYLIKAVFVRE